jgi:opacity protein-like surface antigen
MKMMMTTVAAGLLVAGSLPALAGGPVVVAPEPAPMAATPAPMMPMGGNWSGFSTGAEIAYGSDTFAGGSGSGAMYGLRGAYDYDFGSWVLGGTASYDWSNIDAGGSTLKNVGRVGLRAGPDLGDNFVYVTGGEAWATQSTGGVSATDNGWFAGIGAEHKLTDKWTIGGELLTNRFDNFNGTGNDLHSTTLAANVNFRF